MTSFYSMKSTLNFLITDENWSKTDNCKIQYGNYLNDFIMSKILFTER